MNYKTNRHSCYFLVYELILTSKNNEKIFKGALLSSLEKYIKRYFKNNDIKIESLLIEESYVYIKFEGKPNLNLANFINGLKTNSSKVIKNLHLEYLLKYYEDPQLWNRSYYVGVKSEESSHLAKQYLNSFKW